MSFEEFVKYFEDLAISNRVLKHLSAPNYKSFAMMDIEEIITNQAANFNGMALILENPEYKSGDLLSDNYRDLTSGAFLVVKEFKKGDFKDRIKVRSECKIVCEQIKAKIKNDYMHRKHNRNYQYNVMGIDMASFRMNAVSGLFNSYWVGWRVTFVMDNAINGNLILNEEEWFNEKRFKL